MNEQDYIVVGQGIAGSILAYLLRGNGQKVVVIDQNTEGSLSSSKIAAGVINPITGRRFVKSWHVDTLLPSAKQTYQALEKVLNIPIWHERRILRTLTNAEEENNFLLRRSYPDYQMYCGESHALLTEFEDDSVKWDPSVFHDFYAFAETKNGAQVNLSLLVSKLRAYFIDNQMFINEKFSFNDLTIEENAVIYKNIKAKKIIFAEGAAATQNPYFSWLPFNLDKGELLLVRIPNLNLTAIFKHKISIVPLHDLKNTAENASDTEGSSDFGFRISDFGNTSKNPTSDIQNPKYTEGSYFENLYWVGATNAWHFEHNLPTEAHKQLILNELREILNCPFEVVAHHAAIRPTVKDRRPFIGQHPQFPVLGIFNGFGTKGASLVPFFAAQFVDNLLNGKPLEKEVDIKRFSNA